MKPSRKARQYCIALLCASRRQRIGIARCLLADPCVTQTLHLCNFLDALTRKSAVARSVVLLDEATSALDVRTERALAAAMDELMKGGAA